jgi:hypothetical protein
MSMCTLLTVYQEMNSSISTVYSTGENFQTECYSLMLISCKTKNPQGKQVGHFISAILKPVIKLKNRQMNQTHALT